MKKLLVMLLSIFILTACTPKDPDKLVVGILQWTEHPALDDARIGLEEGLEALGVMDQFELVFKNANEDSSNANMMVNQFVEDKVDLIYAIATPAAQAALNGIDTNDIPLVFNAVTDAVSAGLVDSNEKPGKNTTGISDMAPIDRQLALIKEFLPKAKTVGILYNTGEANSIHQIELVSELIGNHNMSLEAIGISESRDISIGTQQLTSMVDAIYIITDNLVAKATPQVVDIANENKIPVFMAEVGMFEHGILASDSISYKGLGVQAANIVKRILIDQENPGDIPVELSTTTELYVSESVAESLGIEIPNSILERAILK